MLKQFSVSVALAGGLFAGIIGAAGAAHANFDADAPYYGTERRFDAPYYGPERQFDAGCYGMAPNGTSVFFGPNGVRMGLPGGQMVTAGPAGVGYGAGC
jgi:hypothetical protein